MGIITHGFTCTRVSYAYARVRAYACTIDIFKMSVACTYAANTRVHLYACVRALTRVRMLMYARVFLHVVIRTCLPGHLSMTA